MRSIVRIDFHCHSSFSDGAMEPELLAEVLSKASVKFAALTDHNTINGQESFRNTASQSGIGTISGVEITCHESEKEIHILGYGIDLENKNLIETIALLRSPTGLTSSYEASQRRIGVQDAIALIHDASGIAILAHPLSTFDDNESFDTIVKIFKEYGLDGIEVYRNDISPDRLNRLHELSEKYDFLETAGTDYHQSVVDRVSVVPGIDIDTNVWKRFRNAILERSASYSRNVAFPESHTPVLLKKRGTHQRVFIPQIVLPSLITIVLFVGLFFFLLLPTVEYALIDMKRDMIRELTQAAISLCVDAHADVMQGKLSADSARYSVMERIRAMRYGRDGKDYFWIQDTTPFMVMHPYRPELEGSNLKKFRALDGTAIFVQFARYIKDHDAGYVHYVWQWMDDSTRVEPKESYIVLFRPWGWIIGTGVYDHDVKSELQTIIIKITGISVVIVLIILVLLIYILRASLRIEKERTLIENQLIETTERYKTLVNAATEGLIYFNSMHCRYGNPQVLELLGYSLSEFELLDINDIFPEIPENRVLYDAITGSHGYLDGLHIHALINCRDGSSVEGSVLLRKTEKTHSESIFISLQLITTGAVAAGEKSDDVLK